MIAAIILILVLPLSLSKPFHEIRKRGIFEDLLFSEDWKQLYNYYSNYCSLETKNMILKWTVDCIQVCDEDGEELLLDRRGNAWDSDLGTLARKYGAGVTRPFNDTELYLGDACPRDTQAKSLIYFRKLNEFNDDPYAVICNERGVVEFLSLRFSSCPFGVDYPTPEPQVRTENGDCVITHNNETTVDLEHGKFRSKPIRNGISGLCTYEYCCHGFERMFTAPCELESHCDRVVV